MKFPLSLSERNFILYKRTFEMKFKYGLKDFIAEIWEFVKVRSEYLCYALLRSLCFMALPQKLYYLVKGRKLNKGYNSTSSPKHPGTILEKWKIPAGDWLFFFFNGRREELRTKEYVAMRMSRPRKVFWSPPLPPRRCSHSPAHFCFKKEAKVCEWTH